MDYTRQLRYTFRGGIAFLIIEIPLWILATVTAAHSPSRAFILFFIGGIFIAPLSLLVQKYVIKRRSEHKNPLENLSTQLALVIPLLYPLIYLAMQHNPNVVLAAIGIVVGAHYLPFFYVYRLVGYAVASVILVAGNATLAYVMPNAVILPGIFSAVTLSVLAIYLVLATRKKVPQVTT